MTTEEENSPAPPETPDDDDDDKKDDAGANPAADDEAEQPAAAVSGGEDDDGDDDGDDDSSSVTSEDSDTLLDPSDDPVEMVVKATTHKEEGNGHFKAGDLDKAVRAYRKGANLLKPLNKSNTGDEQVKALLVTLQNNLSMVFFKQNKIKVSRDIATKSLKIDGKNVKALYRRAVAHKKMGDLEKARDDLKEALKHDAANTAVKKELVTIKKALLDFKEKQKKAMQGAFGKNASSLYEDKEKEQERKQEEAKKKKELEKQAREKRKIEWEDECVKRMAKNEPAVSFEDWEKEREEKAKKKKDEEEKRLKEERKARQAAKKAAAAAKKAESDSDDDDELTPAELASLRGYKKTADGRVTSYFTKEQSEHEKKAIGDITPQRLDSASGVPQLLSSSSGEGDGNAKAKRASAWNKAGTWEEKDTTNWCTERLQERFMKTTFSMQAKSMESYCAAVTEVDSMTGHASVAITNGKKRYIFDFHTKLKLEIRDTDADEVLAEGTLHLPEIDSTTHDELEVNFLGWKKSPGSAHRENANDCLQALILEVRASVKQWIEDFNQNY